MPKRKFSLQEKGPKRLELSWGFSWKNMVIRLDGAEIGKIANQKDLKAGQEFALKDGSKLSVRLIQIQGLFPDLEVLLNGKPVPNSATDPKRQLANAYGSIYFIAGGNLLIGIIGIALIATGSQNEFFNITTVLVFLLFGALYLLLGFLVWKRFSSALWVAIALFVLDTVLSLADAVGSSNSRFPVGAIIFRTILLLLMIQGFGAIRSLKSARFEQS
ncbi:hypothetical protein [Pantanalinema sp. GBBB05]|uniref:hypothetical protein n=1 Tax=Pantanalinema sp. GBBB05 TaxID=2604139 RepID=UPI001DD3A26E|nr:hypothetical protein [Pantanalinema sp. GBBB05]